MLECEVLRKFPAFLRISVLSLKRPEMSNGEVNISHETTTVVVWIYDDVYDTL